MLKRRLLLAAFCCMVGNVYAETINEPTHSEAVAIAPVEKKDEQGTFQQLVPVLAPSYPLVIMKNIDPLSVELRKLALIDELETNKKGRLALKVAGASLIAYLVWKTFLEGKKELAVGGPYVPLATFNEYTYQQNPPMLSWQWLKGWGSTAVYSMSAFMVGRHVLKKLDSSVAAMFQEGGIEWYVETHTDFRWFLDEKTGHIKHLNFPEEALFQYCQQQDMLGHTMTQQEMQAGRGRIIECANSWMNSVINILGFLSYQQTMMQSEKTVTRIKQLAEFLQLRAQGFAVSLQDALDTNKPTLAPVVLLATDIGHVVETCARIERENQ